MSFACQELSGQDTEAALGVVEAYKLRHGVWGFERQWSADGIHNYICLDVRL